MKVALGQINPTVGDVESNAAKILHFANQARQKGAHVILFPELALTGYPPKDLLLKPQFIDKNLAALLQLAQQIQGIQAIVGYVDRNPAPVGRPLHNALAVLHDGQIQSRHFKTLLPTYDVFDESRYFEPGPPDQRAHVVQIANQSAGLTICEDLWNDEQLIPRRLYHQNPLADLYHADKILLNASASPFVVNKHDFRLKLFSAQVKRFNIPLIYVNQVGGNDELVFDGNSLALDHNGRLIAQAKAFEEDLLIVDLDQSPRLSPAPIDPIESIYNALTLGLRDYVHKCQFPSVVLGLSGGIDSAVTAAIAVNALSPPQVTGIAMPSKFSSPHSIHDAKRLAENLQIPFHQIPITQIHDAYEQTLKPAFQNTTPDTTEENVQARIRGALLMAFSNKFNHLLLTTGNKSELAVGYCTLYGDMCGGLAVISDVPKTTVYQLAQFINQRAGRPLIPLSSITKPPSAELRENQTDQDSLPPYEILDAIIHLYVEEEKSLQQIAAEGFDEPTVRKIIRLIDRSEYKRRQAAPGLKVTSRAFGFGRRMPIAAKTND